MSANLKNIPCRTKTEITQLAYLILNHTYDTSKSFLSIFESIRKTRKAKGTARNDEQDLLRAMLLFASAGLDSMVKQLIRDTLPIIIGRDAGAHKEFEKFVLKELHVKSIESSLGALNLKTLASLIIEDSPKNALIQELIKALISDSLQSVDQLLRVAAHFGITASDLYKDLNQLREVFDVRNRISHEMDIDFSQSNRNRFPRRKNDMINYTNCLLHVADNFLYAADKKLTCSPLHHSVSQNQRNNSFRINNK